MHPNWKLGVTYVIFGQPLGFLIVTRQDQAPWLVAFGVYLVATMMTYAAYEGYTYRTSIAVLCLRALENLLAASVVAVAYAMFMSPDLAGMFAPRPEGS